MKKACWLGVLLGLSMFISGCVSLAGMGDYSNTNPWSTGAQGQQLRPARRIQNNASVTVAAGTVVPFAKVMQPSFAADYVDGDIITVAEFMASGLGGWSDILMYGCYSQNDVVVFRCQAPGAVGEKNPLSGEVKGEFVVIPKNESDIVFTLKAGELVRLRGGTSIRRIHPDNEYTEIFFEATSIEKCSEAKSESQVQPQPAAAQATPSVTKEPASAVPGDAQAPAPNPASGALDDLL
jgi:hypothetical protein